MSELAKLTREQVEEYREKIRSGLFAAESEFCVYDHEFAEARLEREMLDRICDLALSALSGVRVPVEKEHVHSSPASNSGDMGFQGEWIPVSERLPEQGDVWCAVLINDPDDTGWDTSVWWRARWSGAQWDSCDPLDDGCVVTHWTTISASPPESKAGVAYQQGAAPCFSDPSSFKGPPDWMCEKYREPTTAEIDASEAEFKEHMDKMRVVMTAIAPWRKAKPRGKQVVIDCPTGCGGKLHLSQAAY